MKKSSRILRGIAKLSGGVALSAVTLFCAASALSASAYTTTNLGIKKVAAFTPDYVLGVPSSHTYTPDNISYMQAIYDSNHNNHGEQAGTHYNTGSVRGYSKVIVTYYDSKGNRKTKYANSPKTTGWAETPWCTISDDAVMAKIECFGYKLRGSSESEILSCDTFTVTTE